MKYAIIENEIIINTIVANEEFVNVNFPNAIECPEQFGVGDKYSNEKFERVTVSTPIIEEML